MADYTNTSASILSYKGKDYAPGAKISIAAADAKSDATVAFWVTNDFVKEGEGVAPTVAPDPGPLQAPAKEDAKGNAK